VAATIALHKNWVAAIIALHKNWVAADMKALRVK